jgi:hypothetical protein
LATKWPESLNFLPKNNTDMIKKSEIQRERFDPNNIPVEGSLGLLALGDVGFEAWRKAKGHLRNNKNIANEEK